MTDPQLRVLAGQNGFVGRTTLAGDVATWSDEIAFQPSDGTPDTGRLARRPPDRMHEIALDDSYTESWRRLADGSGQYVVVRVEHAGRLLHSLVVVGNQFVYARNRAQDLPTAASLAALIDTTKASREQIVEYLDCEFSVGRVRGGSVPWEIQQSTLPWREGQRLDFIERLTVRDGGAAVVPRAVGDDQWLIPVNTLSARDINALFGATEIGKEPVGHFIFTPGGHVVFSIMRSPSDFDKPSSDPDPDACIPAWYCAYFGT